MKLITIIGATGYIGKNLVAELNVLNEHRIKVLTRKGLKNNQFDENVEVFDGDLNKPESLDGFFEQGCTVINLVYFWGAGEKVNLSITSNLLYLCKKANIDRFIHCSTAAVVGRIPDNNITENTPCNPVTEYGITKLKIEEMIYKEANEKFDTAILRPTSVFGPNGEPLKKLSNEIIQSNWIRNYFKSSLFGRRRMNLVYIDNVIASIIFLIQYANKLNGNKFIISDDDNPSNNFEYVERLLMHEFSIPYYPISRLPIPKSILKFILQILGRNNINTQCSYDSSKLKLMGFKSPVSFEEGLNNYVNWYRTSYLHRKA